MKVKLRIILDAEEDVIRDLEIDSSKGLPDLHHSIVNAFDLEEGELASFFKSNHDWEQGEEIGMVELSITGRDTTRTMNQFILKDLFTAEGDKMLYVYDYFNLWTFFIEMIGSEEGEAGQTRILASVGERPKEAPEKEMQALSFEEDKPDDEALNGFDEDDFDEEDTFY